MEETKNNEVIETMDDVEVIDMYPEEESDDSGSNGLGKLVIAGLGIAAATVGVLAVKNKEKIKQKRLERAKNRLLKAGYAIEGPAVVDEEDDFEDDFLEEEVETDEETEN